MSQVDSTTCDECRAAVPPGAQDCKSVFEQVCALEYSDSAYGAVHLLTVDAYTLQHSGRRGPRSNAFHLMRLCLLLEGGHDAAIGSRSPRAAGKAFEKDYRDFPYLAPPLDPGSLSIMDVHGAATPQEHAQRVRRYAQSVWDAWAAHHPWARRQAQESQQRHA